MDKLLGGDEVEQLERAAWAYSEAARTIKPAGLKQLEEAFVTEFTYDSNAIEGSSLSLGEVSRVLKGHGLRHKALREVREARNHADAYRYLKRYQGGLSLDFVLELHRRLMHDILPDDAGCIRKVQVFVTGSSRSPPPPDDVKKQLLELIRWYLKDADKRNPVEVASYFHAVFEGIHPFVDGNGRTGRLLLNFILMKNGYPPINIRNARRMEYIEAVRDGIGGRLRPMAEVVTGGVFENNVVAFFESRRKKH